MLWILLFAIAPPTVRSVDAEGEPLPPGAVMRLGSVRWMAETTPGQGVSAVFTPDGREVLYWGGDGRVQCRSVATGRSRALPELGRVLEMAFRPDGKQVTVLSKVPSDGRPRDWKPRFAVALFDWPSGRQVLERDVEPRSGTEQVVLALDGGALLRMLPPGYTEKDPRWTFAVESLRDKMIVWERSRVPSSTVWGRLEGAGGVLFQSEGALHFHDLQTGTVQLSIPQKEPIPFQPNASCFRSGDFLFLHFGGHLLRISLEKKQVTHRIQVPTTKLLLRAGGKELLYQADGIVKRLDAATLRPLPALAYRGRSGTTLSAISPDGKTLLLAEGYRCRLVDADTGRTLHDREGHDSPLDAMAFSPDARRIATAAGGEILVWERGTGRCLASWRHPQGIASLSFDATGDRLAVGGFRYWEGTSIAQVRDLRRNRTIFSVEAHLGAVGSVAFTPDCERLVTAGTEDARLRWWNIATGERLAQVKYIERPTILDIEENRVLASDGRGGIAWYRPNGTRSFLVGEGSIRSDFKVRRLRSRIVAERSDGVAWCDSQTGKWLPVHAIGEDERASFLSDILTEKVVIASSRGPSLEYRLHDAETRIDLCTLPPPNLKLSPVVSADGRWLLIQEECTAVLYDMWQLRAAGLLAGWLDDPFSGRLLVAGDRPSREALRAKLLYAARIEEKARRLIEQLGDDDFEKRVATQRQLRDLGSLAAPALIAAARDSDDLEIRTRCKPLVEAIAPAARARWGEPLLLEAMLRCLREGPVPGGPALCDEIARTFPDSLIRRLARSIKEAKP